MRILVEIIPILAGIGTILATFPRFWKRRVERKKNEK